MEGREEERVGQWGRKRGGRGRGNTPARGREGNRGTGDGEKGGWRREGRGTGKMRREEKEE